MREVGDLEGYFGFKMFGARLWWMYWEEEREVPGTEPLLRSVVERRRRGI